MVHLKSNASRKEPSSVYGLKLIRPIRAQADNFVEGQVKFYINMSFQLLIKVLSILISLSLSHYEKTEEFVS